MTHVRVHLDAEVPQPAGTARITRLRGTDQTEFTYDTGYLEAGGWALSPDLPVREVRAVVEGLPGALADSAPDAWGRNLITRRAASRARDAGHPPPTLTEVDFLLDVADATRQGALRLCLDDAGPYVAERTSAVPPLIALGELLDAARRVTVDDDATDAVAALLDAGSGSLGGARPKASVADGDILSIAKFPHPQDEWSVIRWEVVALDLAAACELRTPAHRLVEIGEVPVLVVERFDRSGARRIPYLSGRSLIQAKEGAVADYLDLVDALSVHGSDVATDLVELWRRVAFSVAINNTDDHMRNHGFLRGSGGWTLSPLFDVNPNPVANARRVTSLGGASAPEDCMDALIQLSRYFGLSEDEARSQWHDLTATTSTRWRELATDRGISAVEQHRFSPVFDRWSTTI